MARKDRDSYIAHFVHAVDRSVKCHEKELQNADFRTIALELPEGTTLIEFFRFNNYNFQAIPANGDAASFPPAKREFPPQFDYFRKWKKGQICGRE